MAETRRPLVVQIVPNDHPPFADISTTYRLALESLGVEVLTLILAPSHQSGPVGTALVNTDYLNLDDLQDVRLAGRVVRRQIGERAPILAVCHRYRAYRVLRASGVAVPRVVAVAHEFGFFKRLQRRIERRLFARQVVFAGVSPAVQAELGETVAEPLCLPNAMDLDRFEARLLSREDALASLGVVPSQTLTIGLVGRLVVKKAPQLALMALRELVSAGQDVRLLVIGDGPLGAELRELAADLPVTFCGFVPEARSLLRALDLMLLTSEAVEAFGMVALEAMAAGVPVVSGLSPGPQFVLAGSGYYFTERTPESVAAAIMRLEQDTADGELAARIEHARARAAREFSVAALAGHLDDLLIRRPG